MGQLTCEPCMKKLRGLVSYDPAEVEREQKALAEAVRFPGFARCPRCNRTIWDKAEASGTFGSIVAGALLLAGIAFLFMRNDYAKYDTLVGTGIYGLICTGLPFVPYCFCQGGVARGIAAIVAFFVVGFVALYGCMELASLLIRTDPVEENPGGVGQYAFFPVVPVLIGAAVASWILKESAD